MAAGVILDEGGDGHVNCKEAFGLDVGLAQPCEGYAGA